SEAGGPRGGAGPAAIGGVEVDDVAQQHLSRDQLVAPADERAIGGRALADAADHHVAAGLDALGDGDFALARQQLHAAHLAQIHAHGIVGAADIVVVDVAGGLALVLFLFLVGLRLLCRRGRALPFLAVRDLFAHPLSAPEGVPLA